MDIVTKLFLINFVTLFFFARFDRVLLEDYFEKRAWIGFRILFGGWVVATMVSIPAWIIYLTWVIL